MTNKLAGFASVILLLLSTFTACNKENAASDSAAGKGGSLARFTVSGNYLYAVDNQYLYTYSLINPAKPEMVFTSTLNFDIETIYPYNNHLFIGSKTGLYIYSIDTPQHPALIGEARHARSCDPVVVNDSVAFVTLRSMSNCGSAVSGLYINDIKNFEQPILKKVIELPEPVGMGLQDSVLYVCCGNSGLKLFNIKDPYSPRFISSVNDGNFVDVIAYDSLLICYVSDGILLYDISQPSSPAYLKKITN